VFREVTKHFAAMSVLAAAVLLRGLLDPVLGDALPFVTIFGAVAAAVWIGGYRPGIAVAVLGYVACSYLFIEPRGQLVLGTAANRVGLIAYLFTCALIITFGEATRIAQVRASEQQRSLQVTLGSIGDAVITTDTRGTVTYLNAVAETLTGWRQSEAVGRPLDAVFRIVNESTRQPAENPGTKALREGATVGLANHTVLITREGLDCPIDDSAAPIRNEQGEISGCVLIFRDVTARRRLESERAQQLLTARLLASIVESSDDAIISKSLEGVIQSWNAAAVRVFGYTEEQAVGRHISLVIPPDRIAEEDQIISALRAGRRIEHFETERLRADGRRVSVSLTVSPVKDDGGRVVGASKIVRDITDRKQAEADRDKFVAELAEADRRKNEFLAMLAHELRTPLAPISNAIRALRAGGGPGGAIEAAYGMLERQAGQMARLVDDLLDMSRITRGRIELRTELVELAPIAEQAVEAARSMYTSMNHELTVTLPDHAVYVSADRARLAQVIGNLLNNAAKFTDRGGHVWLTVSEEGSNAVIRVRDSGIGMAADELPRIFDMFQQVDTTLERSRDGLGIGLTLVKTLVEMQSGTVEARSDGPGLGSEFIVRLPILVDAPSLAPAGSSEEPTRGGGQRILIVDDSQDGAESLSLLLQVSGYETHKAYDGIEAVEAAERLTPDAILLDIGLPRLNGYDACRRIRQEPWGARILLVALTGWGMDEDRDRSRDAGFDTHLVKPVDAAVLLKLLGTLTRTEAPQ
jgi:PAS domain S-box-containing protein